MTAKRFFCLVALLAGLCGVGCAGIPAGEPTGDSAVAAEIQGRLAEDTITAGHPLGVKVEQGVATITGVMRDAGVKARAISIVTGTPGVTEVVDRTTR